MELNKDLFPAITAHVAQANTICILTHSNPDGDAMGSSLAWCAILSQLGKTVRVIIPNNCPEYLQWLQGYRTHTFIFDKHKEAATEFIAKTDLFFCLDFNTFTRVEELGTLVLQTEKPLLLIDHHPNPTDCFSVVVSNIKSSSTCELVYRTIQGCGYETYITTQIAEALYVGIVTDTGNFSHNSSRPEVYRVVADLLSYNIHKNDIHDQLFNVFSFDRMKLLGTMLKDQFVYLPQFHAAYMYISRENQNRYNFQVGDSEGFVNLPLTIKDVVFCALFTEYDGLVKLSFRSKFDFPANAFAHEFFKGGGHLNAAGAKMYGPLEKVIRIFTQGLPKYRKRLNETYNRHLEL
ncbi:MAG: bifunctional oligoribonuclease/PAP phosphatase NrnA [Bacteroidales bacterium]|jgi:phosphoesterase RecJ-like protein|nr:bifunctional oligoribonuclease/PAP phosphatase NrnA [Bacteroidales bacterium]